MSNTKRNHYIPQGYLKLFFNDTTDRIYRYEKTTGKIMEFADTKNIGIKNDLYTITKKISEADVNYFKGVCKYEPASNTDSDIIKILCDFMNDDLSVLWNIKIAGKPEAEKFINEWMDRVLSPCPDSIARNQEDLCTMYETDFYNARNMVLKSKSLDCLYPLPTEFKNPKFWHYLKLRNLIHANTMKKLNTAIRTEHADKLSDAEKQELRKIKFPYKHKQVPYFDLFFYTIFQIFRVPSVLNSFKDDERAKRIKEMHGIENSNVLFLMLQFWSITRLVEWHVAKMKPVLIENATDVPFITSDKPSFNRYGKIAPQQFDIYFPLSKNMAILYSEQEYYKGLDKITLCNVDKVLSYNKAVFDNADKYVFASDKLLLC